MYNISVSYTTKNKDVVFDFLCYFDISCVNNYGLRLSANRGIKCK